MNGPRHNDIDELQAQISLSEAAQRCNVAVDVGGSGRQVRLDCPFGCPGDHSGRREISVDTGNPQKVFYCHAYGCHVRGNLLALMHGWLTGTPPTGGKLRGAEYKRVRDVLAGTAVPDARLSPPPVAFPKADRDRNIPLAEHDNPKAQELATLDEKFVVNVETMPPAAARYVRRHPCLSPAALQKWRAGVLPLDGGGDKRGWSLRGHVLYPIHSEDGQLLAWVARDPQFEDREKSFKAHSDEQRRHEKPPISHRFPVDFHRGQELFGQQASRLKEPGYREAIARYGVIVVEGFNDVIALDSLGIPAVGIMSNKLTEGQSDKVERWARSLADGKVLLLFDADGPGDEGMKEAAWQLLQRSLHVRLGWTERMHDGAFSGRQPESLQGDECMQLLDSTERA